MELEVLKNQFAEGVTEVCLDKGQAVVKVTPQKIHDVLKFCKEDSRFAMNQLSDVIGVDYLGETPRFEIVYLLYSIEKKHRLRLRVRIGDGGSLPTAVDLYQSADWVEREVYDMFGIKFTGHPNLKRILLFEGFEGHPLRKDYPIDRRQRIPKIEETL